MSVHIYYTYVLYGIVAYEFTVHVPIHEQYIPLLYSNELVVLYYICTDIHMHVLYVYWYMLGVMYINEDDSYIFGFSFHSISVLCYAMDSSSFPVLVTLF